MAGVEESLSAGRSQGMAPCSMFSFSQYDLQSEPNTDVYCGSTTMIGRVFALSVGFARMWSKKAAMSCNEPSNTSCRKHVTDFLMVSSVLSAAINAWIMSVVDGGCVSDISLKKGDARAPPCA